MLLLDANKTVTIDQLVDALWEDPPQTARHQVRNAVAAMRRTLGQNGDGSADIVTTEVGYRIELSHRQLDAQQFAAAIQAAEQAEQRDELDTTVDLLCEALGLWRGPALAGFEGSDFVSAAARLEEQRLSAVERLFALRLARGESSKLVGELMELVRRHPLRESLRGSLMLALLRSGRQPDALAVYEEGRRRLADELGLDPGPLLRQLHQQVIIGDRATSSAAARSRPGAATLLARLRVAHAALEQAIAELEGSASIGDRSAG